MSDYTHHTGEALAGKDCGEGIKPRDLDTVALRDRAKKAERDLASVRDQLTEATQRFHAAAKRADELLGERNDAQRELTQCRNQQLALRTTIDDAGRAGKRLAEELAEAKRVAADWEAQAVERRGQLGVAQANLTNRERELAGVKAQLKVARMKTQVALEERDQVQAKLAKCRAALHPFADAIVVPDSMKRDIHFEADTIIAAWEAWKEAA